MVNHPNAAPVLPSRALNRPVFKQPLRIPPSLLSSNVVDGNVSANEPVLCRENAAVFRPLPESDASVNSPKHDLEPTYEECGNTDEPNLDDTATEVFAMEQPERITAFTDGTYDFTDPDMLEAAGLQHFLNFKRFCGQSPIFPLTPRAEGGEPVRIRVTGIKWVVENRKIVGEHSKRPRVMYNAIVYGNTGIVDPDRSSQYGSPNISGLYVPGKPNRPGTK